MTIGDGSSYAKDPAQEALVGHLDLLIGQERHLIAWRRASLVGRLAAILFFKLRVLLRHRKISCEVKLFFLTFHYEWSHKKLQRQEKLTTRRIATKQVRGPFQPSANLVAHPVGYGTS